MKLTLDRHDVCRLLLATTHCSSEGEHWEELHDRIKAQLVEWDAKHEDATRAV